MNKLSVFQTILIGLCGLLIVVGILIFAGVLPGFKKKPVGEAGNLTVWGSLPQQAMDVLFREITEKYEDKFKLTYAQKSAATFSSELTAALAEGRGPDLIIGPHEFLLSNKSRLAYLPAEYLPKRDYLNRYIDEASLFIYGEYYAAFPIAVDPMVMFYNRDLYNWANLSLPPKTWEEFVKNQPRLTVLDERNNVLQSAAALGTFNNINNAKDIFSLLLLQAGNPIAFFDGQNIKQTLGESFGYTMSPAQAALGFFLEFADPAKATYNWNRSLPEARENFLAGKSANYFGLASELPYFSRMNPHLSFDVSEMPQQDVKKRLTFGRLYGVALLRASRRPGPASYAMLVLADPAIADRIAGLGNLTTVSRASLALGTEDPYRQVFYRAALVARAWPDVSPERTGAIFRDLTESVASGRASAFDATKEAAGQLQVVLN